MKMGKDRLDELQMRASEIERNKKKEKRGDEDSFSKDANKIFDRTELIRQKIETIEYNVEEIKRNLVKLEDIRFNQKDVRDALDSLFQKNTALSRQITQKFKDIQAHLREHDDSAQGRIENIQYTTLKTRFKKAASANMTQLENYQRIQKDILKAHLKAKGTVQVTDEELTALIQDGKQIQVFTENILAETAEARSVLADIEERHGLLLKIEQMLVEVKDLFLQLAMLVDEQGEMIDRVEYQATVAKDHIGKGMKELDSANKKKRKFLKRKIWCGIIIAIVVAVIILLFIFVK